MTGILKRLRTLPRVCGPIALACILLSGCSAAYYRKSADKEVYKILAQKRKGALQEEGPFTIEQVQADPLEALPKKSQPLIRLNPGETAPAASEKQARPLAIISLPKAVELAIQNSREYQAAKEDVFLSALSLTLERYRWTPQFSALLSGRYNRASQDEFYTGTSDFGVSELLATGGTFTANLAADLLRYTTGDPRTSAASLLTAQFIQPLWRGAGRRIAQENLTQAERNVIYSVRSFARRHRTFAVAVATSYYQLLQRRSIVQNEYANYQRLVKSRESSEMLAQAGRLPEFQVDLTRQAELSAKDSWISAEQDYWALLDQFKVQLGLRTDADVDVDEEELTKLLAAGIVHPNLTAEDAFKQAFALRLDLMNQRDAAEDAARKVHVAADGLGPDVSLVATAAVPSSGIQNRPTVLRFEQASYTGGLDVNLPLNRKAERNTYRQSLIELNRAERDLASLEDNIRLQVRQEWRTLQERKESYAIQLRSVSLAERRVAGTTLLLEAGRASTRDQLDAQSALRDAQNALIGALVDHTVARLQLWRDVETLLVTPEGTLEESANARSSATNPPAE